MSQAIQSPSVADSKIQSLLKSLLPVEELFEKGHQRARLSCAEKRLPEDLQVLEDYARAVALDVHTDPYDPANNAQDTLREAEYQKYLEDRKEVETALDLNVLPRVRQEEADLAKLKKNITEPKLSPVIMLAAILVISLSVAPTLHDRLFLDFEDPLHAWAFSITGAAFIATLITWSLVGAISASTTAKRSIANIGGLIAGIGISIGTGLLRLTDAATTPEYVFAIALTIVEIFAIVFLDWLAKGLRERQQEWMDYQNTIATATAGLDAANTDLARWKQKLAVINSEVEAHIAHVEERWVRHNKVADIELTAVKTIIDGYDHGIAENKGRRLGLVLVK